MDPTIHPTETAAAWLAGVVFEEFVDKYFDNDEDIDTIQCTAFNLPGALSAPEGTPILGSPEVRLYVGNATCQGCVNVSFRNGKPKIETFLQPVLADDPEGDTVYAVTSSTSSVADGVRDVTYPEFLRELRFTASDLVCSVSDGYVPENDPKRMPKPFRTV